MATSGISKSSRDEIACAGGLLVFGLVIVVYGLRYPALHDGGLIGPGFMPLVSGVVLIAAAAVLLWQAVAGALAAPDEGAAQGGLSLGDFAEDDGQAAGRPGAVFGILALLAIAVLLAPLLGLLPMLGGLVFVCVYVLERQKLAVSLAMAVGAAAVSWLLFVKVFAVPMPFGSVWQALGL